MRQKFVPENELTTAVVKKSGTSRQKTRSVLFREACAARTVSVVLEEFVGGSSPLVRFSIFGANLDENEIGRESLRTNRPSRDIPNGQTFVGQCFESLGHRARFLRH